MTTIREQAEEEERRRTKRALLAAVRREDWPLAAMLATDLDLATRDLYRMTTREDG